MGGTWACSEHPSRTAPYFCPRCKTHVCDDCATPTEAGRRQVYQCKKCDALLSRAGSGESTGARHAPPIWERIPDIFTYVTRPSVWLVIVGMAVLWWVLRYIPFGGILMGGIEAAVFFRVLESTAFGAEDLDPPDFSSVWDDLMSPLLRYIAAVFPIIFAIIWGAAEFFNTLYALKAGGSPSELFDGMVGPVVLLFVGVALLPLLFAVAAIGRSVLSMFNPAIWIQSIRTMGVEYLVGSAFFYVALAVEVFVVFPLALQIYGVVDIVFVGPVISFSVAYFPMIVKARIIGAMCEPFMDRGHEATRAAESAIPTARIVEPGKPLPPAPRAREPVAFSPNPEPQAAGLASADDAETLIAAAKQAYQSGDYGQAVEKAGRILKHHPNSPEVYNALWLAAHAQEKGGRVDLMEKSLRKLLASMPEGPFADRARAKLRQHGIQP